jgi:DNA-binding response OmpR family regulator
MNKRVLVVDDERLIRRLVEVNLLRAGYRVHTAEDGEEALAAIRADRPDLVVLDVMMPRMDGFELLTRLREDPELAELPVIVLSARAHDRDIFEAWRRGATMYLTKPFRPADLLTTADRILRAAEREAQRGSGRVPLMAAA